MATAKQIAANRRNARQSTGPKTKSGKRRASGNAYRHELSARLTSEPHSTTLASLARTIAGNSTDEDIFRYAVVAARAHINLARIRQVKFDIIERVHRFGALKGMPRFRSVEAEIAYLGRQPGKQGLQWPQPVDPLGPMPSDEPARVAEAVRRLLPELKKLYRYERRSITMRDRALRSITLRLSQRNNAHNQER